jgi:hypothetical protein
MQFVVHPRAKAPVLFAINYFAYSLLARVTNFNIFKI